MNLKKVLMDLGNRLVQTHGFLPATGSRPSLQERSTFPIKDFTDWVNSNETVQNLLSLMGVDWPMPKDKANRPPKGYEFCPECYGGYRVVEEDGRQIQEACYYCGNTGYITKERARLNRINQVIGEIAVAAVMAQRKACNEDPDGEGWGFHAAENRLSEHEYTALRVDAKAERLMQIYLTPMRENDPGLYEALMDYFVGKEEVEEQEEEPTVPPYQAEKPKPDPDEIPF